MKIKDIQQMRVFQCEAVFLGGWVGGCVCVSGWGGSLGIRDCPLFLPEGDGSHQQNTT